MYKTVSKNEQRIGRHKLPELARHDEAGATAPPDPDELLRMDLGSLKVLKARTDMNGRKLKLDLQELKSRPFRGLGFARREEFVALQERVNETAAASQLLQWAISEVGKGEKSRAAQARPIGYIFMDVAMERLPYAVFSDLLEEAKRRAAV